MTTAAPPRQVHVDEVMGTVVSLCVRGPGSAVTEPAFERVMAWLRDVDARFSTYRDDSEISRIARGHLAPGQASADVQWVLERCDALRKQTRGAFDAYARGRLDPSGLVKGWAVQRGADMLAASGLADFSLNAGGDVVVRGAWRVGIQHPYERGAIAGAVELTDAAVATSGSYERGAHIVPRGGAARHDVLSVTVLGPDLGLADAWSTAAFALGADGPQWTLSLADGYEAMTILADATVLCTPGFPLDESPA
jgi:FAD:protein FMN transferase